MEYDSHSLSVADASIEQRARFIVRTYAHLVGAIALFTVIEVLLFTTPFGQNLAFGILQLPWLLILGGFIVVGWMARSVAWNARTPAVQYLALGGFVLAEAIIFLPLLLMVEAQAPGTINSAALVTLLGFAALTWVVWHYRADFQFLRSALMFGGIMALVAIVAAVIFGFELGTWFSVGMIVLAGMSILHDTSNVMIRYPSDRHVSAALELFASVALLFWYVLRLMSQLQRD
jgi:uncharacterized protein